MNTFKIGILGGMGPRATAVFENKLIESFQGTDQAVPSILTTNNGSIPDRTDFLIRNGADPLEVLIAEANILASAKVDVVCMPCNTAHNPKILARLMAIVPLPVIDMPAACMLSVENKGSRKVLILGTTGTSQTKIFDQRALSSQCVYPDETEQEFIDSVIKTIKARAGQPIDDDDRSQLINLIKTKDCDETILACTELSLIPKEVFKGFNVLDSMDILIERCLLIGGLKK